MATPDDSYFTKPTTREEGVKEVLTSELASLDFDRLRSREYNLAIKDPENLTHNHFRLLRKAIYGFDEIRGIPDLEDIDKKLQDIADARSRRSRSSSLSRFRSVPSTRSSTPIIGTDEARQLDLQEEKEAYAELVQNGGRPSHHLEDFDLVYSRQHRTEIIVYWEELCRGWLETIISRQCSHWRQFREHQDWTRRRYNEPERFKRLLEAMNEYRREKGIEGDMLLLQDRARQSTLEDWKEYQVNQLRHYDHLVKQMRSYEDKWQEQEIKLQTAIDDGQAAHAVNTIRDQDLAFAEKRCLDAQIKVKRTAVLLKWIDEQFPLIASECGVDATAAAATQEDHPESSTTTQREITGTRAGTKRRNDASEESDAKRQKRASKADHARGESSVAPAEIAVSASDRLRPNTRSRANEGPATAAAVPGVSKSPAVSKRQPRTAAAASRKSERQQSNAQISLLGNEAPVKPAAARTRKAARKATNPQQAVGSDRPVRRSERLARKPAIHYP